MAAAAAAVAEREHTVVELEVVGGVDEFGDFVGLNRLHRLQCHLRLHAL